MSCYLKVNWIPCKRVCKPLGQPVEKVQKGNISDTLRKERTWNYIKYSTEIITARKIQIIN